MKSFVVIGCGRFGASVAKTISEMGKEVLAIDADEELVQEIAPYVTHAAQADVMDETVLANLGISNFDAAVVAIGSELEASIMATLITKELGVPLVVAKAQSLLHGKILKRIGADQVIYPERDMGIRVAHNLISKNILDFIDLSSDYSVVEILALSEWIGRSLAELRLPNKYGVSVVAIKRRGAIIAAPRAHEVILSGDALMLIGEKDSIRRLEMRMESDD